MIAVALILSLGVQVDARVAEAVGRLGDAATMDRAHGELAAFGPKAALELVRAAAGQNLPVQAMLRDVVVSFGVEALPALALCRMPMLVSEFSECDFAIAATAKMDDAVLPVLEAWAPETYSGRGNFAMRALRALGFERASPSLERLSQSTDRRVARDAFSIIASWNDPRNADSMLRRLKSDDVTVLRTAIEGLGGIRDRRVLPFALTHVLADERWSIQEASVFALGDMYESSFRVPIFRAARGAPEVMVRRSAAGTLERAPDEIAQRLGMRYRVISVDPAAEGTIAIRYLLLVLSTAAVALFTLRICHHGGWTKVSSALFILGGYYWGNVTTKINGSVEREILLFCIPMVWMCARVMGTRMSNLKDLAIPFVSALGGGLIGSVVLLVARRVSSVGAMAVALYGWVLVPIGFLVGAGIAVKRFAERQRTRPSAPVDARFTRLATICCSLFYAGYVFGWWKLWGYSTDAFWSLL